MANFDPAVSTPLILSISKEGSAYRNKKLEAVIEGRPEVIIHNGKRFTDLMVRAQLTHHELDSALRRAG